MTGTFDPMVLTLLLPLLGALLVGTTGRHLGKFGSSLIASGAVGCSFLVVLSTIIKKLNGVEVPQSVKLWNWMQYPGVQGGTSVSFGIYVDALSLTLMSVITGVGFLIHLYSMEYMEHDDDVPRFFTLLNIFIAAMTFLVLADNYATLIIGWGGVGFASFALIGFWREKPSAAAASKKAFVMNVIGDVGLMIAVFVLFKYTGTVDYATLFTTVLPKLVNDDNATQWLTVVTIGLMIAAYAKSAQLPLHTWLPDAMEGPTPVSALIHAATMVTAGVYLLVRSSMFLDLVPYLGTAIAFLGAVTALFAAICAMVQTDLKRVLAYSTMSQLGYMFMAVGVGAYGPAIFHLVTHAFFKALLFLSAGIVIHAAHGEQDMRKLGGLAGKMPATAVLFGGGAICLAGVPLTSGFFSKESILHAAQEYAGASPLPYDDWCGTALFVIGALVAVMTAFYTGRAFFMTFYGPNRVEHPHLPGAPTTTACAVLWVLALGSGWIYNDFRDFLDPTNVNAHYDIVPVGAPVEVGILSALVVLALVAAAMVYGKGQRDKLGDDTSALSFIRRGLGFDDFYGYLARSIGLMGGLTAKGLDPYFQEGLPGLIGRSFHGLSYAAGSELQTGQTRFYMGALTVVIAVFLLLSLVLHGGAHQ